MQLAAQIADENAHYPCDAIFIDGGGVGGGVVDRCRQLGLQVIEVQFGARSDRASIGQDGAIVYANKRAEIWGSIGEWLRDGAIDNDPELLAVGADDADLTNPDAFVDTDVLACLTDRRTPR